MEAIMNYLILLFSILFIIYLYKKISSSPVNEDIKTCTKSLKELQDNNYLHLSRKIVGVSFKNSNGSSRQRLIEKYVELNDCLVISFYKYEGENACAIYAKGYQIGNFSRDDAQYFYEHKNDDINVYVDSVGVSEESDLLGVGVGIYLNPYKNKSLDINDKLEETTKALKELGWTEQYAINYGFSNKSIRKLNHDRKWEEKYSKLENNNTKKGDKYYVYQYTLDDKIIYIGKATTNQNSTVKYSSAADIYQKKDCRQYKDKIVITILKGFNKEDDAQVYKKELLKKHKLYVSCLKNIASLSS